MNNHHLTKKEKYLLKKQKKEQERLRGTRQNKIRKIAFISLLSLSALLLIGGVGFVLINYLTGEGQEENQGTPKLKGNK